MKIDKSNYEIWLIDWLDGNLNDFQVEQLQLFLNENPDLKEEFNELNTLCLKPSEKSFPQKDQLLKSVADLSGSQFEYLCATSLEKDLSTGQQIELNEIICQYPEKKRIFELVQKMRLTPSAISYKFKHKLKKRTLIQEVIRISAIGLSAAATVALFIITYTLIPWKHPAKENRTAQIILVDSTLMNSSVSTVLEKPGREQNLVITKQKREKLITTVAVKSPSSFQSDLKPQIQNDSLLRYAEIPESLFIKIPLYAEINLPERSFDNTLIEFHSNYIIPLYDDEQSSLSKFIARTFRQKILKENISKDSPLKAYEIAEAGVTGLNKLLGWEMALDEKKDESGELTSVYFSSRILKFNAPVKKTEPLQ